MQVRLSRFLVVGLAVISMLASLSNCAWFKGKPVESVLIKPQPIGGYDILGTRIHYPRTIREQGIEGTVIINAFVSETGQVTETRVVRKLNPDLDKIAANAVQRTLFYPALRDGIPEGIWISIPIVYALSDWQEKNSPFEAFEMIVRPNASYQIFDIEMRGSLKKDIEFPERFEVLLPFNSEKVWVKTSSGQTINSGKVRDESGEWLIFEANERQLTFGYKYRPIINQSAPKFDYIFTMNHPLPKWVLALIYSEQKIDLQQAPNRTLTLDDGAMRFEYDLESLDAYELRYLEIGLK